MIKRKQVFVPIALILFIFLFVACSPKEPLKIGVIGTMTGPSSDLSVSGRRGVELAVAQINENGGINGRLVELVIKDDQNDTAVGLEQQKSFVKENIQFVIGHFTSGMTMGVMDYVNQQDMLLLGPTISADSLSKQKDHFIRFIASTQEQATILTDYAKSANYKSMWIVFDERNKGFTDQLVLNFQSQFLEKTGISVSAMAYNPADDKSVTKAVEAFKTVNPEGVFVIASSQDCAQMVKHLKAIDTETEFLGPLWANTTELIKKGGEFVDGMVLVGAMDASKETPEFTAFDRSFRERYGQAPTFASVYAFETMMTLKDGMTQSKSAKPQVVLEKILEIGTYNGLHDEFTIDAYGDNTRTYLLFKVDKGIVRKVE